MCSVHYIPPEPGPSSGARGTFVNIDLVLSGYNASVTRLPRAIFSNIVLKASPLGLYSVIKDQETPILYTSGEKFSWVRFTFLEVVLRLGFCKGPGGMFGH